MAIFVQQNSAMAHAYCDRLYQRDPKKGMEAYHGLLRAALRPIGKAHGTTMPAGCAGLAHKPRGGAHRLTPPLCRSWMGGSAPGGRGPGVAIALDLMRAFHDRIDPIKVLLALR